MELDSNQVTPDSFTKLVILNPGFDRSVYITTAVHITSNCYSFHRITGIHWITVRFDHLRHILVVRHDPHLTGVTIVRLESLLVDLLLTCTKVTQLTISLDHLHHLTGVFFPLSIRQFSITGVELLEPWVVRWHDEVSGELGNSTLS